jgi:hypothetical protein
MQCSRQNRQRGTVGFHKGPVARDRCRAVYDSTAGNERVTETLDSRLTRGLALLNPEHAAHRSASRRPCSSSCNALFSYLLHSLFSGYRSYN